MSAIRAFDAALSAKSLYVGVVQKAEIQDRRGDLYLLLEPKDSAENIENAIAAYKAAIEYKPQGNKVELRKRAASAEKLAPLQATQTRFGRGKCRAGRRSLRAGACRVHTRDLSPRLFEGPGVERRGAGQGSGTCPRAALSRVTRPAHSQAQAVINGLGQRYEKTLRHAGVSLPALTFKQATIFFSSGITSLQSL